MNKEMFMKEALIEAKKALEYKETPIGAVVVLNDVIVGRGYNSVEKDNDSTSHAEINAIKDASKNVGFWRLSNCQLYTTLEPCFMCCGAIANSRIKKVYIGAKHIKNSLVDKHNNFKKEFYFDNKIDIEYGILESDCSNILTNFFKERRKNK